MSQISISPEHIRINSLIETIQQHPAEVLEDERRLMSTKWFDYRFLSPREANRLFTRTYQDAYRRYFAATIDREFAGKVSGVHALTMETNTRERSQLAIARQRADQFGMSYPAYIEAAFDFARRRGNMRKAPPRPSQLHGNGKAAKAFTAYVTQRWQELLSDGLVRVEHPAYLIDSYRGMAAQDDFRRFVLGHVRDAYMPLHRAIRLFTHERRQVPADLFRSIVTDDQFAATMEIVESDLRHHPLDDVGQSPITTCQLWPTCFGLHYTHEPASAECAACPQVLGCKKVGDLVLRKAAAQAGVSDPAGDYKRRLDRERQQRFRDRKREEGRAVRFSTLPNTSTHVRP